MLTAQAPARQRLKATKIFMTSIFEKWQNNNFFKEHTWKVKEVQGFEAVFIVCGAKIDGQFLRNMTSATRYHKNIQTEYSNERYFAEMKLAQLLSTRLMPSIKQISPTETIIIAY